MVEDLAGTGTTLKVAKQHGCRAVGIELNAAYVDLIKRRLLQETQHGARREEAA